MDGDKGKEDGFDELRGSSQRWRCAGAAGAAGGRKCQGRMLRPARQRRAQSCSYGPSRHLDPTVGCRGDEGAVAAVVVRGRLIGVKQLGRKDAGAEHEGDDGGDPDDPR